MSTLPGVRAWHRMCSSAPGGQRGVRPKSYARRANQPVQLVVLERLRIRCIDPISETEDVPDQIVLVAEIEDGAARVPNADVR